MSPLQFLISLSSEYVNVFITACHNNRPCFVGYRGNANNITWRRRSGKPVFSV
jgi:hypothetical protein